MLVMLRICRSRGRDRAHRSQTSDFGIRFFHPGSRLASGPRRCRPRRHMNRRGASGGARASARAAASRSVFCPLDEIGENPIARHPRHWRRKKQDQTDNCRVSRYRSCKRRHMTTRARPGRIVGRLRFVLFVQRRPARPKLRGSEWKRPGATNDYAAVRRRQ